MQPIRKNIINNNPDITVNHFYTLLVDGNNLLRQCFADEKTNPDGVHYGAIFQFFLQLKLILRKHSYDYVYVTFDDDDSGILRYSLYEDYKVNRRKKYKEHLELSDYGKKFEENMKKMQNAIFSKKQEEKKEDFVDANFARERDIVLDMCEELAIRTIFNKQTEGDDIIAYYVLNKKKEEKIVIVSSDCDLMQLISDDVCVYDRRNDIYFSKERFLKKKGYPVENILVKKIFLGDSSDNIGNIYGLSEKRLLELMPEFKTRPVTVDEVKQRAQNEINNRITLKKKPLSWHSNIISGKSNKVYKGDFYEINEKIINLKKPLLTDDAISELKTLMYQPIDMEGRSFENLYRIIKDENMTELLESNKFANFFSEFKGITDKELKRCKKLL